MSAVQWPWPSDRIHELEAESLALREQVKRLIEARDRRDAQITAVWDVLRESQRIGLSVTSNSDILTALGAA